MNDLLTGLIAIFFIVLFTGIFILWLEFHSTKETKSN